MKTVIRILLEAIQEAENMADVDAEAIVDQMESLGLEPELRIDI